MNAKNITWAALSAICLAACGMETPNEAATPPPDTRTVVIDLPFIRFDVTTLDLDRDGSLFVGQARFCEIAVSQSRADAGFTTVGECIGYIEDNRDDLKVMVGTVAKPLSFGDCDDQDPNVYPGAAEIIDGKDNDCNSATPLAPNECLDGTNVADMDVCDGTETCMGGVVQAGTGPNCDDNNPCTNDSCNAATGCAHTNLADGTPVPDANMCNGTETCQGGVLTDQADPNCDDGNACTADSCDASLGCLHNNVANGTACTDSSVCTQNDTCQNGACQAGPAMACDDTNPCTNDSCNAATGCVHTNNNDPCEDGTACTIQSNCSNGTCDSGTPLDVDDNNPCTVDSCDASLGAQHTNVADGTPVPDANACNGGEICMNGAIQSGTALNCDDNNPCTTDSCAAVGGCSHTLVVDGSSCADGNACNGSETCQSGACQPGTALNCDDNNPCTTDSCAAVGGCSHANVANGTLVLDGSLCNGSETCQGGAVTPGTPLSCDDSNSCTTDTCNPATGCAHASSVNGSACTDSNACTQNDTCQNSVCSGTSVNGGAACTPCVNDAACAGSRPANVPAGFIWGCGVLQYCTSCADTDGDGRCSTVESNCNNGLDEDGDGVVDCFDSDCSGNAACTNSCFGSTCASGQVCSSVSHSCDTDTKGDTWPGVSGANGGAGGDGTGDHTDDDGRCDCEIAPCTASINPLCTVLIGGDCDDDGSDGAQFGVPLTLACKQSDGQLVFREEILGCPVGSTYLFTTDGSYGNGPGATGATETPGDGFDNNCDGTWQ